MKKVKRRNSYQRLRQKVKESIWRTKLILGIPITLQDWRGFAAEDKAEYALKYFKKKKIIRSYKRTTRFDQEDLKGKDFIVELIDGKYLYLDVKSYNWHWGEEQKAKGQGVTLLTIWRDDDGETAKKKIFPLIILTYLSSLNIEKARELIFLVTKVKKKLPKGLIDKFFAWIKG